MKRTVAVWASSFLLTLGFLVWQKASGPTHEVRFDENVAGARASGELMRSHSITADMPILVNAPDPGVTVRAQWRRFPTEDDWQMLPLVRDGDVLRAALPRQKMAGKLEYFVHIAKDGRTVRVPRDEAAVARYKGDVPAPLLVSHVACMIIGVFFSTSCGLTALLGGRGGLRTLSQLTFGFLLLGGCILGPLVQKHAFDAYWTGWPLGSDWTDNKLAVGALVWLAAAWRCRAAVRGSLAGRWWVVAAMFVTFVIYGIPHSIHGSTLDYGTGQHIQAQARAPWPWVS